VTALIDYNQFCGIAPEPAQAAAVKNGIPQISVKELKVRLDKKEAHNDNFLLLDVREPYEFQIAQIGGKLIPQNDVPNRLGELNPEQEIVVHCRSGARSQKIAEFLAQNGFKNVSNVAGGILAWSDEIDPSVQKY
jgi:adenylyltransferase/sulfurtransferase